VLSSNELPCCDVDGDIGLMLRVRDLNDSTAFEDLVSRYRRRLLAVLFHWCGSRELAEDLCQEVFLRVFRSRQQYQPSGRFSTWLFTIAHRVASNGRRTLARRREVAVPGRHRTTSSVIGLDQLAVASSGELPSRVVDRCERAEAVRQAVAGLHDRQRMAVLLAKFEHMSYEEIGIAMHLSVPAVKSLLVRARESLRQSLSPLLEDPTEPKLTWRSS